MVKIHIHTFGCTMNQADSDMMAALLEGKGHEMVDEGQADVIILNTCTVKGPTENKIMERIRKLEATRRETIRAAPASPPDASHPRTGNPKLVICGCMSVNSAKIRKLTDAPIVWPGALRRIGAAVHDALEGQVTEYRDSESKDGLPSIITTPIMRLSIAEGCTGTCSYCQTKLARPGLRSVRPQTILKRMTEGIGAGAKEIQITAMDTGAYGLDIDAPGTDGRSETDLPSLLNCINEMEGDFFVRIGMINPDHVKRLGNGLVDAMQGKHMFKFLHIPVQSGSDKVCRDMQRKYTVAEFERMVGDFRIAVPGITIATDIIVGYPTEQESDFQDTLSLLSRVKPDVINLSKFSPRPGTKAKELKQLDNNELKRRSVEASALVRKICAQANEKLVGKEFDVLILEKSEGKKGGFKGRTPCYKQVVVRNYDGELGKMIKVKITDSNHGSLFGEKIEG